MNWVLGEAVFCWSQSSSAFFKGTVEYFDDKVLQIRMFSNGKIYNFRPDGSGYFSNVKTGKRVFALRELNETSPLEKKQ